MKHLLAITLLLFGLAIQAQTYKLYRTDNIHNQLRLNTKTGEVYQIQNDGQKFLVHWGTTPDNEQPGRYKLQKTENMWTFILLDTYSGKIWQCQYSVKGTEYIGSWEINPYELSETDRRKFTIEPMTSMYQFYLINDENGDMWKFQWSTKGEDYRWIEKL